MNIFQDSQVIEYIESLDGLSPVQLYETTVCQCIQNNIPEDAHLNIVIPFSSNLAELAANREQKNVKQIVMYITKSSYFNGDTMKFLISEMLICNDVETVEQYYHVLDNNLMQHPPCAHYMYMEYDLLLLSSTRNYFEEMALWDYIIERLSKIADGSILYGSNKTFDLAFKRCFSFCVYILQIDFEVSKKKKRRSLVAKCLKYKLERRTRMSEINKLLDKLYNTGYEFKMPIIHLAILVNQLQ